MGKADREADTDETLLTSAVRVGAEGAGRLHLVVLAQGGVVSTYPLPDRGEVSIGRSEMADVCIRDPSLSRKHVLLTAGERMTIEDLGSANGTWLRGQRLEPRKRVALAADEAVEIGTCMFVVQHRAAPVRLRRLWNHDYFEGRLFEECARAERSGGGFGVVRLHAEPREAQQVQEVLGELLRAVDVFALYAPGEYEVLLVESGPDEARAPLQRIVGELERRGAPARLGVAYYPSDGRDPDSLLAKASADATGRGDVAATGRVVVTEGAMQSLHRLVERVAQGTLSVLVLGETGVGKEVMAETVHRLSPRREAPFLRLSCAALPENLLESELFGHERGSFTGAVRAKPGLLETAQGGTVFLDEVGELPMAIQVKLLRVLEERRVLRVGGLKSNAIDVRFVAATNRDLEAEVARGTFRQDLFFRLNGITLVVPPLRERASEIEGLARAFIAQACAQASRDERPSLAPDALALLQQYGWPGNIRELRNLIERAVLLCTGDTIGLEHLPVQRMRATFAARYVPARPTPFDEETRPPRLEPPEPPRAREHPAPRPAEEATATAASIRREMADIERRRIAEVLERCAGNQTQAAKLLGISRRTLVNRLEVYGMPRPRKKK
jgi:DNA-binding NtrC family response regulator